MTERQRSIKTRVSVWWQAHKLDEQASLTFVHKYPMQLIALALALGMLVAHVISPRTREGACLPDFSEAQTHAPLRGAAFGHLSIYIPETSEGEFVAYSYPREDGALAFDVSTYSVGITELQDESNGDIVGEVYIDAKAQAVLFQSGKVYVGVH